MTELLTAAQMRAIEQAAIASGEVTGLELMERAGRGVVEAIFEEWPELKTTSHRAVVLCGPGNNGGDGFVVARLLKEWGWEVEIILHGDPSRLPPSAEISFRRWIEVGGDVHDMGYTVHDLTLRELAERRDYRGYRGAQPVKLYVDALFGIGLDRAIDPMPAESFLDTLSAHAAGAESWNDGSYKVVSIDVPSGLCSNSGKIIGGSVCKADLTVALGALKLGHFLAPGSNFCGKIALKDLGLESYRTKTRRSQRLRSADQVALLTGDHCTALGPITQQLELTKHIHLNKYSHGHALILSGPSGRGGAARLAARGALRIGAGVVTVGCPLDAIPENAARLDAVMLRGVADGLALEEALGDARINALCVGPGLGLDARGREVVAVALGVPAGSPPPPYPPHAGEGGREGQPSRVGGADEALPLPRVGRREGRGATRTLVLDADALTILSQNPDLFAALHKGCVLTPHAGEFARLFPDIAEKLAAPATKGPAYSKVDATREAAARAGCVVLYKGPDTVIADPSGRCAINSAHYDRAAPWLATAGSGDVLAGFITGLLARGFSPFDAACTGAWLHVECALSFGPGLIAEDLPEELPKVFRALGV